MHLDELRVPQELKGLSYPELSGLAQEIRMELIDTVSRQGGHLASNLGVVELTIALHRVFDMPTDKLVFDVGHQSYVHKLLTGRLEQFRTLRSFGGMSGFPKRSESDYDVFETGHASTAISAALGLARARDYQGKDHHVIALVGDGALTGGMCYEALNDAGNSNTRLIVILNDNEMSIAPNVGALSRHLTDLRASRRWRRAKEAVKGGLGHLPLLGKPLYRLMDWMKESVKSVFVREQDEGFFTSLGFHYYGPIDGHDLKGMERTLRRVKEVDGPVVLHVMTRKGFGYMRAEEEPETFHGMPPFYVETGACKTQSSVPAYGAVMADELGAMAAEDERIVAITAAMALGTGLSEFEKRFPGRTLDVGITEEHAVTMAAGMAAGGMKPYFAVYASFFQRGFDQLVHDVCLQNLPVTFLIDRAGLVGEDGATHHGLLDLASMLPVPNMTVLAPRDIHELRQMLRWSGRWGGPCAIRYGRGSADVSARYPCKEFVFGQWELLERGGDCSLLAVGSMVEAAVQVRDMLAERGIKAALINCSTVKPLDLPLLRRLAERPYFTLEEHMLTGGFGAAVCEACAEEGLPQPTLMLGVPNTFVQHGSRGELLELLNLLPEQMTERVLEALRSKQS